MFEELALELWPEMIKAKGQYNVFWVASEWNHFPALVRSLDKITPECKQMVLRNFYPIRDLKSSEDRQLYFNRMLLSPPVFAYAEMHDAEYRDDIVQFVNNQLEIILTEKARIESQDPNAVFDISDNEKAKLVFYMAKNLIRRGGTASLDKLCLLLDIPSVKELAHTEDNALLRLALSLRDRNAVVVRLLTIPAVRTLAVANNLYRDEAHGGLDLEALARDRESSVAALTSGEQRRLQTALTRYQPTINAAGAFTIVDGLRETLIARYQKHPAVMKRDDQSELILPFYWQDFQRLPLSASEKERALIAYYQHPDHTAWRYLAKPNLWMNPHASFVYVSEDRTERWSTFEEYQPLIALCYLAAQDETTPAIDGYTVETRLERFINELALIARAHNWDASRARKNDEGTWIDEEYDDLTGDKPSCFSGVKRRLFQSVLGHPLFKVLTLEVIQEELRDFLRQRIQTVVQKNGQAPLKQAWDAYVETLDPQYIPLLKTFDITPDQTEQWIAALALKYGPEFATESRFRQYIRNWLKPIGENEAQICQLGGLVNIEQLLESSPQQATASSIGFFSNSAHEPSSSSELPQNTIR